MIKTMRNTRQVILVKHFDEHYILANQNEKDRINESREQDKENYPSLPAKAPLGPDAEVMWWKEGPKWIKVGVPGSHARHAINKVTGDIHRCQGGQPGGPARGNIFTGHNIGGNWYYVNGPKYN